jgi:hypothetical protein
LLPPFPFFFVCAFRFEVDFSCFFSILTGTDQRWFWLDCGGIWWITNLVPHVRRQFLRISHFWILQRNVILFGFFPPCGEHLCSLIFVFANSTLSACDWWIGETLVISRRNWIYQLECLLRCLENKLIISILWRQKC